MAESLAPEELSVEAAIEAVYRRRFGGFLRVAVALVGDRELAREAVQESFARALRERKRLRADSVEPWLYRVLINHCRNVNRDARRRLSAPLPFQHAAPGSSDARPDVRAAVAALPERQRLVLFLRYYADLDYAQIAEAAGIAPGTVAATLHTARAAIRATMEEGAA